MEYKVNINSWDLIKAIFYSNTRNKFIWGMCIVSGMLIYGISYVGLWAMGFPLNNTIEVTVKLVTWIVGLNFFGFILTALSLVLNPRWRKGRAGEHFLEIRDEGIVESTTQNRTQVNWSSINKIKFHSSSAYFIHSGSEVFIVPKRCFSNNEEWVVFNDDLKSKWNLSRQKNK